MNLLQSHCLPSTSYPCRPLPRLALARRCRVPTCRALEASQETSTNGVACPPCPPGPVCEIPTSGVVRSARLAFDETVTPAQRRGALIWERGKPTKVLIIKKPKTPAASLKMQCMGEWLKGKGLAVFVESSVFATEFPQFSPLKDEERSSIDFCITLGGDGTLLHLASLFDRDEAMPPTMSFALGTLGFLTPFDANFFEHALGRVLDGQPLPCTLRTRLRCELVRRGAAIGVKHHVLNEVVVDRGAYPGSIMLELFIDDSYLTTIEADGLIIATPSGSTAYSMSVGGSLIAPSVPCTILSPIAPHSLSFRPVVIPETSSICLRLPEHARSGARVSFDGKSTMDLQRGTFLLVEATRFPLPTINLCARDLDWYEGITQKLKWNQALRPTTRPLASAEMLQSGSDVARDGLVSDGWD